MFKSSYRYLYILLLAVYSYLNIKFTEGDQLLGGKVAEIYLISLISFLVVLIWEANRFLFKIYRFNKSRISTPRYLLLAFLLSLISVFVFSGVSSSFSSVFIEGQSITTAFKLSLGFAFRVNLFLHCINAIVFYQQQLLQSEVDMEVAQKENVLANYHALKRQISPHFLFNSLNVLDELINEDPKRASDFLTRLSRVYRYVTRNQNVDLVTLEEELDFIKSYIYLVETRFNNNLKVHIEVQTEDLKKKIVPAALQILVENTIKHNEISETRPLEVWVKSDSTYLIIFNPIQAKMSSRRESIGVGLQNITKRYEFFIDTEVIVRNDGQSFEVKLPLLTSDK